MQRLTQHGECSDRRGAGGVGVPGSAGVGAAVADPGARDHQVPVGSHAVPVIHSPSLIQ